MARKANRSPKRRASIAKRDGPVCWLCGRGFIGPATLDHVVPRASGGRNGIDNLKLAHKRCNGIRGCVPAEQAQAYVRSRLGLPVIDEEESWRRTWEERRCNPPCGLSSCQFCR